MSVPAPRIGQVLAHYRLVELIGVGGMGMVYRAHDEQLDRDVAIKVLPPGSLTDDAARVRFKKEALALAKLNHPNIATIFEFGSDHGVDFLVIEYIRGLTLDAKLASGALSEKEVISLGIELAQGLAAAHDQGVIHRDLKPGNLRITLDGRLKILDFGLAQLRLPVSETAETETVTKPHEVKGTLPYMAPEQLRGQRADARSDVYAAGTVLYEMATAHRPFESKISTALAADIIHRLPPQPRVFNKNLSRGLQQVILKCLEKELARRYQTASELRADLERLAAGLAPRTTHRSAFGAGGLALLLAVGFGLYFLRHREQIPPPLPPTVKRPSVAVLGFRNLSGKSDVNWLSTALSEMLSTELAAGEKLRTIPGEDVAHMKIDLSLPDADSLGKESLARLRKNLGSDFVVLGSYLDMDGRIRLDLRLQDAHAGETIATFSDTESEAQLPELASRTGEHLREKLGIGAVSPADALGVKASVPSNPEATRLYSQGLDRVRLFDAVGGRGLLQEAIAADPSFALAHSALAAAWSNLGYDQRSKEEAKKAYDLSSDLPREQQLWIEGRHRESMQDWDKAIEIYRALYDFVPDNLDYGVRLALAQDSAGKPRDALVTIAALRRLAPPQANDPRIDLAEAAADDSLSDYTQAEKASESAVRKGEAMGAQLLTARARSEQCWTLKNLSRIKEAINSCQSAKTIYANVGDRNNAAWALNNIANILTNEGNLTDAKQMYEEALAVFQEIGNENYTAGVLGNLANVELSLGDFAAAKKMHEESLRAYREIGNTNDATIELVNLADILEGQGDLVKARNMYEEALRMSQAAGSRENEALALTNLAGALFDQGDLPDTGKALEKALASSREIGDKHMAGTDIEGLGDVLVQEGDLAGARKKYEEALALRNALGEKGGAAESSLAMAAVSLEGGKLGEAESSARKAADEFHQQKQVADEASAQIVLARVLLAHGDPIAAQEAIDRALPLARASQNRGIQLLMKITVARIAIALGKPADAARSLQDTQGEAAKFGFGRYELESRLAMGEIEMKSGLVVAGRTHLRALEKDARAKSFLLIARKAAAAAKGTARANPQAD